jgi:HEPN domain-containing protein
MIDIKKQIAYWRQGAQEDWGVAQELVDHGWTRHGLFFAHLALEKALKAHVCARTLNLAPRTHHLLGLAEAASLDLAPDHEDTLADMNTFALEGRYPETEPLPPSLEEARAYLTRCKEAFEWLMQRL